MDEFYLNCLNILSETFVALINDVELNKIGSRLHWDLYGEKRRYRWPGLD